MTESKNPAPTTPGRPDESSSRQQVHKDQSTHTGSKDMDRKSGDQGAPAVPEKPPGAK